jgi:hypothetical protein
MNPFLQKTRFHSLSIRDLLEARDAYHVHIANLENVVGTAIGRYLVRDRDSKKKPESFFQSDIQSEKERPPRTLNNSRSHSWSWPCVLVFVSRWVPFKQFSKDPSQYIPSHLYLPDGRVIPTCVVHAPQSLTAQPAVQNLTFPSGLHGGGYPLITESQGRERVGSVGCLVSDGIHVYALTSRHVVGEPDTPAYTIDRGERLKVAESYRKGKDKVALSEAYPGWPGLRSFVNVDAGLFKITDLNQWTAQVYGLGRIGPLIDLNVDTLNLDLIGVPLRGTGGASGVLEGQILALFYRYRSVGGFDYVAEILIGPRKGQTTVTTRPGDSGTIWFWDPPPQKTKPQTKDPAATISPSASPADSRIKAPEFRPVAIQWGGYSFLEPGGQEVRQFALASSLATVCRELDIEVVRDWSIGQNEYWGKVGHYKIGISACSLLGEKKLATLMKANAENISVKDADIEAGKLPKATQRDRFIPLADVPDLVWRATRGKDKANHFADMDEPDPNSGKTLLQLWKASSSNRTPGKWSQFYSAIDPKRKDAHRGALPFRVRQIYEEMVEFTKRGDIAKYVGAAGILAHYVGDACQPLHVSFLHHGHPDHPSEKDVHEVYETRMLDSFSAEVVQMTNLELKSKAVKTGQRIVGGAAAADLVVELMRQTIKVLPPEVVVDTFNKTKGRGQLQAMWTALGKKTCAVMADGSLTLAILWESAWVEGKGSTKVKLSDLIAVDRKKLMSIYNDKTFIESRWLKEMKY